MSLVLAGLATSAHAQSPGTSGAADLAGLLVDARPHARVALPASALIGLAMDYGVGHLLPKAGRADIPVTNCNDAGPGSLRSAVAAAASSDRVDARSLGCGTITLTSGQIQVFAQSLHISGPGRDTLTIRNGSLPGPNSRVFRHTGTGTLTISAVTIADGAVAGVTAAPDVRGGCIHSDGTVMLGNVLALGEDKYNTTVRDCSAEGSVVGDGKAAGGGVFAEVVLMGNSRVTGSQAISHGAYRSASAGGGGVFARSRVGLAGSEVSGNVASGAGKYAGGGGLVIGQVVVSGQADSALVDSTVSGNTAWRGGGLMVMTGTQIINSTISGNTSMQEGGGLWAAGLGLPSITLANSTVADNSMGDGNPSEPNGGGVWAGSGAQFDLQSTIVAGNRRAGGTPDDLGGDDLFSGANNLVGVWFGTPALPPGTIVSNPNLLPLADNGGRTPTHTIGAGSLAIDAGNNITGREFDQRGEGFPRVVGAGVDIGAVEFAPIDLIFADGFE